MTPDNEYLNITENAYKQTNDAYKACQHMICCQTLISL